MKSFFVVKAGGVPAVVVFFVMIVLQLFSAPLLSQDAKAQPNQDIYERLQIEAMVLSDGALLITETRQYNINYFRSYFLADIAPGDLPIQDLQVFLNGELLSEFETMPDYATNPAAEEPGPGYVADSISEAKTLSVFGRFGETELRLRYRLEGAVQRAGSYMYLDHIFGNSVQLSFEEAQKRPSVRGREGLFSLIFERKPMDVSIARLFAANDGEPLFLDVFESDEFMIRVNPITIRPARPLPVKMLFSGDAVPDLPRDARTSEVTKEDIETEYQVWLENEEAEHQRQQETAEKLGYWRPFGWVMLFLTLFTAIGRRVRKRKRRKEIKSLDFNQKLSMDDVRKLPLPVIKILYNAMVLQPRNHVLRLTGLGLVDLARAGHIRISSRMPLNLLEDPDYLKRNGMIAFRKLIPIKIKQIIQQTDIQIQPLDEMPDDDLRPWQKVLLQYIRSRSRGEAIELKTLFPSKTKLKELEQTGPEGSKQANVLRKSINSLKETLREAYFDDLLNISVLYEEKRVPIYLNILAVLAGIYLLFGLGSFLGFFLVIIALPTLFFAIINRYERTVEGVRYSNFIRETFNVMRKSSGPTENIESAEDLLSVFVVLNWPRHYYELYNRPHHPQFARTEGKEELNLSNLKWITFNLQPDIKPDRMLHFHNFILQDVCMRSLMQYPDFVAGNSKMLNSLFSKKSFRSEEAS